MDNLAIYNKYAAVPKEAQKPISGGRLSGMTDINPMWRIKCLTEQFGPAGWGWYPKIIRQWTEIGADGVIAAFCEIALYVKYDGEWSAPISATGGSMLVAKEKGGLYTSDECHKMAFTDALSVACKFLGFGADVYWSAGGDSKYQRSAQTDDDPLGKGKPQPAKDAATDCEVCGKPMTPAQRSLSQNKFGRLLCPECQKGEA